MTAANDIKILFAAVFIVQKTNWKKLVTKDFQLENFFKEFVSVICVLFAISSDKIVEYDEIRKQFPGNTLLFIQTPPTLQNCKKFVRQM